MVHAGKYTIYPWMRHGSMPLEQEKNNNHVFLPIEKQHNDQRRSIFFRGVYRWPLRTQGLYGSIWDVLGRPIGLGNPHIFTYKTGWWVLEVFICRYIYTKNVPWDPSWERNIHHLAIRFGSREEWVSENVTSNSKVEVDDIQGNRGWSKRSRIESPWYNTDPGIPTTIKTMGVNITTLT